MLLFSDKMLATSEGGREARRTLLQLSLCLLYAKLSTLMPQGSGVCLASELSSTVCKQTLLGNKSTSLAWSAGERASSESGLRKCQTLLCHCHHPRWRRKPHTHKYQLSNHQNLFCFQANFEFTLPPNVFRYWHFQC